MDGRQSQCLYEGRTPEVPRTTYGSPQATMDGSLDATMQHRSHQTQLAPMVDNAGDCKLLCAHSYVEDDALQFCDCQRRSRLNQHLLCADTKIAALIDGTPTAKRTSDKLRSYFKLIFTNERYEEAYYTPTKSANGVIIELFSAPDWFTRRKTIQYNTKGFLRKRWGQPIFHLRSQLRMPSDVTHSCVM